MRQLSVAALIAVGGVFLASPAKALTESQIQACAQLRFPTEIDLRQPVPQQWVTCLPNLASVAKRASGIAGRLDKALERLPDVGNEGRSNVNRVVYNVALQQFDIKGQIRARHVVSKTIKVPKVRMEERCVKKPWGGKWCEKVPVDSWEEKTIKEPLYSATCNFTYTQSVINGRVGGNTGCGQGAVGVKVRFDAIASLLQGQMPSLSEVIRAVDFRTPIVKDASQDTYENTASQIMASNPGARVYFSSKPFVQWASAEELGLSALTGAVTLGAATPLLMQKIEGQLRTEGVTFTSWAASNAIQMGTEELIKLLKDPSSVSLPRFRPQVKMMNVPIVWNKCLSSGPCTGNINKPRLGFAIIFQPI